MKKQGQTFIERLKTDRSLQGLVVVIILAFLFYLNDYIKRAPARELSDELHKVICDNNYLKGTQTGDWSDYNKECP